MSLDLQTVFESINKRCNGRDEEVFYTGNL